MNETLKSIVRILDEGTPELKVSAAQILGELAPKDKAVVAALDAHLTPGDNTRNRYILEALAKIGSKEALRVLVGRLRDGGMTRDLARHLLSSMGDAACIALAETFDDEMADTQAQIVSILAHYTHDAAISVLIKAAMGEDAAVAREARNLLFERLDALPEADRKQHRETIYGRIKAAKDMAPQALANGLRLMAAMHVGQSRATLLKHAQPDQPAAVRRAALLGLEEASLTPAQSDVLLGYLEESDQDNVVRPTLVALAGHTGWSRGAVTKLRGLLSSRKEEMKLFALRALREAQSEEIAKVYMGHLASPKPELREVAVQALGNNAKALAPLLKALQTERDAEKARVLVRALLEHAERIKPAQLKTMTEKCGRLLADGNELGEIHLELLLRVKPERVAAGLVDKAVRLRRARKLNEALVILMHLARSGVLDAEGRYQLALARLLKDHEEGRSGSIRQTGDATMGYLASLVRDGFPAFERLKKESMLAPEDLLRVGRHFRASIGAEQRLGSEMLEFVAKKHAKARVGEEARMMIRSEGVG